MRGLVLFSRARCPCHATTQPARNRNGKLAAIRVIHRISVVGATLALAAAVPLVALRITAEERLLTQSPDYQTYAKKVRWRLLSFLW